MALRIILLAGVVCCGAALHAADLVSTLQSEAVRQQASPVAHWGPDLDRYSTWTSHTNRMIPVYTYGTAGAGEGIDLTDYTGPNSIYRDAAQVRRLYHDPSEGSVSPAAEHMDQTNVFDLQHASLMAGKRHIFLVVFDGMDWVTTRAASVWNLQQIAYTEGRGRGTHFQEYQANGTSQYGWMVTSPSRDGIQVDVNHQQVKNPGSGLAGGYDPRLGGRYPWSSPVEPHYLVAGPENALVRHAYTDSASSASSMTSGIKTYNGAVNIDAFGRQVATIAHRAQAAGYRVGIATSVPVSHATPAAAYGHNVSRSDYQDLTRDMLGLPSISHPGQPLPGMDVVVGAGHGVEKPRDNAQGENFVPSNVYLTDSDLASIDVAKGGRYVVATRQAGQSGTATLQAAAKRAAAEGHRLFGFYGIGGTKSFISGNLPFASADGDYRPATGINGDAIDYSENDLAENPTLADMTSAALKVLAVDNKPFWLLVEAGDVDWANHENNLDASIGAVNSGDAAVRVVTDWVERHSNWDESVMILTGDHGHFLVLDRPELLIRPTE